jgi:hypothetical protein
MGKLSTRLCSCHQAELDAQRQYLYFGTSKASKPAWSCHQAELAADGGHLVKLKAAYTSSLRPHTLVA